MEREELIDDIESLHEDDSAGNVNRLAEKYNVEADNADDLIDQLMQYTSHLSEKRPEARTIRLELQPDLDLQKYQGLWYDVARIPQPFDRNTPWETAQYKILDSRTIQVVNTAYNKDDSVRGEIVGTAEVIDDPSSLYVSFPTGQPRMANPEANYLIHKTDYVRYAVVGSYDGSNLYILSRTRPMAAGLYANILRYVSDLGYDVSRLQKDYRSISSESDDCNIL